MQTKAQTTKEYFKSLTILHFALLIGQVLFGIVTFYINSTNTVGFDYVIQNDIFLLVAPVLFIGGILSSTLIAKHQLKMNKAKTILKAKLGGYMSTLIIKLAILEGVSLCMLVFYYMTANLLFLLLSGLTIVLFIMNRPTKEKAINDLELNQKERALIEDPEAIVAEIKINN